MSDIQSNQFHLILSDYERIIYHLINKFGIRDSEKEFYQEGVIALWRAVETYDESRGKFSSYAYFLIEKALISLIRKNNRYAENNSKFLDNLPADISQVSTWIEPEFDPYLHNQIKAALTDNQWKWFLLFVLEDLSIKEIAAREQVTEDAVKNWGRLAKPKIKNVLLENS